MTFPVLFSHPDKRITGYFATVFCEFLFGFSFLFSKKAVESTAPLDLIAWRFAAAAFFMGLCLLFRLTRIRLKGKNPVPLLVLGLLFPGLYHICEALGICLITAAETGMLLSTAPVVTLIFSYVILHEKPTVLQTGGILLTVLGMTVCVTAKSLSFSFSLKGYCLVGLGVAGYCLFTIGIKKIRDFTSSEKTFVMLLEAFLLYFPFAVIRHGIAGDLKGFLLLPLTNRDLLYATLYLAGACSLLCVFLINYSISAIGASRFTSFIGLETVVAITAGVLILNESFSIYQTIGSLIILGGIYLANLPEGGKAEMFLKEHCGKSRKEH